MSGSVRGIIKTATVERLGRYARLRIGIGVDDLINEALDNIERGSVRVDGRVREKAKK